jgi:hypothetical protein
MPRFKTALSVLSIRPVGSQPPARLRRWGAGVATSLVLLACGAPAELDLGRDENALEEDPVSQDNPPTVTPPDEGGATGTPVPDGLSEVAPVPVVEPVAPTPEGADYAPCAAAGTEYPVEPDWPATVEPVAGVEPDPAVPVAAEPDPAVPVAPEPVAGVGQAAFAIEPTPGSTSAEAFPAPCPASGMPYPGGSGVGTSAGTEVSPSAGSGVGAGSVSPSAGSGVGAGAVSPTAEASPANEPQSGDAAPTAGGSATRP